MCQLIVAIALAGEDVEEEERAPAADLAPPVGGGRARRRGAVFMQTRANERFSGRRVPDRAWLKPAGSSIMMKCFALSKNSKMSLGRVGELGFVVRSRAARGANCSSLAESAEHEERAFDLARARAGDRVLINSLMAWATVAPSDFARHLRDALGIFRFGHHRRDRRLRADTSRIAPGFCPPIWLRMAAAPFFAAAASFTPGI